MRYWTVGDLEREWGMKGAAIRALIKRGRVVGAHKLGRDWLVPAGTLRPIDRRYRGRVGDSDNS